MLRHLDAEVMENDSAVTSPISQGSSVVTPVVTENSVSATVSETALTSSNRSSMELPTHRPPSLREIWEMYIRAVKSQDQSADNVEKQAFLLNILLKLCAQELKTGSLPNFSDMKGVCGQLCKEFMTDILHITSRSEDDDTTQLQNYLLEGRGWILLQVIHEKGIQTLTGHKDFANLLVYLLPWCLKFPLKPKDGQNIDLSLHDDFPPIIDCFQNILKTNSSKENQSVPASQISTGQQNSSGARKSTVTGKRKYSKRKPSEKDGKDLHEDTEEESSETKEERSKGKLRRKFRYSNIRMQADMASQPKPDSDSDDDDVEAISKYMNLAEENVISGFDLCVLILKLVQELTYTDLNNIPSGKMISPVILPNLLQCLVTVDEAMQQLVNKDQNEIDSNTVLKRFLVRLIIICSGMMAAQANGMNFLTGHRVIEQLLTSGWTLEVLHSSHSNPDILNKFETQMCLMSDIVIGALLCLTVVFENLPFNLTFIKAALHLVEEFDDQKGFQMLEKCIMFSDWKRNVSTDCVHSSHWLDNEPIRIIGTFLSTLKVVRVNYIHSMKCVKRKHQQCTYSQYFNHHHDILGVAVTTKVEETSDTLSLSPRRPSQSSMSSITSQQSAQVLCLVSSCSQFLLDLLGKVMSKVTRLDLLKTIHSSGICCCMNLETIVAAFIMGIKMYSPAVRTFSIDVLNKIILDNFSGGLSHFHVSSKNFSCTLCDKNMTAPSHSEDQTCLGARTCDAEILESKGMDSGIDSDINIEAKLSALHKLSKWRAISQLKCLLYSENEPLATSVAKHLLVLAIKGNPFLKAELFFSLYSQALDCVGKGDGKSETKDNKLAKSVQVHCLSALPYLLQTNCVTKVFLSKRGVRKLCELLEDQILRAPVLRIFEALVVLDSYKLDGSRSTTSEDCPCPSNGGKVIEAFLAELSKRSFSNNDMYCDESELPTSGRVRRDSAVISKFSLPVLVDLWETCAKLCLHSNVFVSQFSNCYSKTESLLLETLDIIVSPDLIGQLKSSGSFEAEDSGLDVEPAIEVEKGEQASFFQRIALLESLMVVLGAGLKHEHIQEYSQVKVWQRFRERFTHTVKLEAMKIKLLLDSVLSAAMPEYTSLLQYSYSRNIALVHARDDDIYDEDEVRLLLQSGSEEDNGILTEIGYDADSEDTFMDDADKDKQAQRSVLKLRAPYKVYLKTTFSLLLDLLVLLHGQDGGEPVVSAILHKLLQNVRMDVNLARCLSDQDILSVILGEKGFRKKLLSTEQEATAVTDNLLGLMEQLGQHRLESRDLQKFLQLFQHSDIPMEKLLMVFLTILERSAKVSQHSVTFPCQACERSHKPPEDMLGSSGESLSSTISPLIKTVTNLFMNSLSKEEVKPVKVVQEVWDRCALQAGLKDAVSWPPLQIGITITLWLCLSKGENPRSSQKLPVYDVETGDTPQPSTATGQTDENMVAGCLHMVSIGTKEKLLETWVDVASGSLIFRLTSESCDTGLVVQECRLSGVMSLDTWHHLVITYKESYEGSTVMGNVGLVVDGWQSHSVILDHPHSAVRSRHRSSQLQTQLCLGHTTDSEQTAECGRWQLGQMMLFKGSTISKEQCFHLYTLGPNNISILKCDSSGESMAYAPHLNKNTVLHSKIHYDFLVGLKKPNLSELRQTLILSYNPGQCKEMTEYPPVMKVTQSQISGNMAPDTLLTQFPKVMTPVCQGHLHSNQKTSLEMAISESGGMAAILFLVAKVYERCPESMSQEEAEKIQSAVLRVLMSVMHQSSQLHAEFINIGGHALLCKVLTSSRCVPGQLTLKVIMDAATTETLYKVNPETSEMTLKLRTDSVIQDVTIIEHLVLHWYIWERCSVQVVEMLFAGLAVLVQEEHPHQNYNIKQYQAINIVSKIFKIYQERIQEGFPSLSVPVGNSVVSIIQNLAGSPPDYHLILEICDFLLMVHPAANTYINHSKSLFYFMLPWGQPPSPLTKWKIGLGQGLASSTPVKIRYTVAEKVTGKIKRNLSDSFINDVSDQTYPDVEISIQPLHMQSSSELEKMSKRSSSQRSQSVIPVDRVNVTFKEHKKPEFTISESKDSSEIEADEIVENNVTKTESNIVKQPESLSGSNMETEDVDEEMILAASTNLHVSTRIPSNFESLYKKTNSCDETEQVRSNLSDENSKNSQGERSDSVDEDVTTCFGLNDKSAPKDKSRSAGNVDRDKNVQRNERTVSGDTDKDSGMEVSDVDVQGGREEGDLQGAEGDLEEELDNEEETDITEEASGSRDNLSLNFDEDNAEMLKMEKGLTGLCVGLLRLLSSVIVMMPDNLVSKTFQKSIISAETFIVLAQNSSAEVREAVIKLLSAYLDRCNSSSMDDFVKMEGFHLLAAQLYQYPTHPDQMEATMSIVLKRPFQIDEGLHSDETVDDLTTVQQAAIPLMLSLLGKSLGDLALCHNSIQFCSKLYETSDIVATVMMEQGIVEVLSNMLMTIIQNGSRDTDVEGMDENEILLGDLVDFYKVIAIREFSASGPQHYQQFEDVLVLLQDMEANQIQTQGVDSMGAQMLRTFQQHIAIAIVDLVERTSEEVSNQSTLSFFTKPTSASSRRISYEPQTSSYPALPPHRNLSMTQEHLSLSGTFGKLPFRRKSPGGYFIQSDNPYGETSANSGSGGESDSSQESWVGTGLLGNPTVKSEDSKRSYSRTKSIDIIHGRPSRSNSILQTVLSIGKRKRFLKTNPISQNELIERLKKVITFAVDSAMFAERKPCEGRRVVLLLEMSPQSVSVDRDYMRKLFNFLYRAFEATLPQDKASYQKRNKNVIMWGAKDVIRVQLGRLLGFMLSDKLEFDQRAYVLSFMMGESRGMEVLKSIIATTEVGNDLGYYMYDLMTSGRNWLSRQQTLDGSMFINHLISAGLETFSPSKSKLSDAILERLTERKKMLESRYESHKTMWIKKKETALMRIFHQFDSQASKLSDSAMEVTQNVTQLQTRERNKFITYIKQKKTESIQVKKQWQEIVQNLTHERALWYDEKSYPQSWQLNPTEGPCRVRKRLQRGHLGILPKFLKKEYQYKLASETVDPPLIYLFEDDHQMSDSAALIYQLHKNKKIRYTSTCRAVSPFGESKGELLIGEDSVFFVADEAISDNNYTQVLLGNKDQLSMTWPFEDVVEILKRWYELTDTAVEIFLTNGKTCLLAFKSTKERDDVYQHLVDLELPNRRDTGPLLDVLDRWQTRKMTNFEYLTYLNKKAGRSFNDLMQYPIMPFILRDYTSETIDLRDFSVYRDLSKPVSVQDPKNEHKFKMNYEILKGEYEKYGKEGITGLRVAPYHYGSHYSNSGCVLHFLVRLPPFTKMFLGFQDQSFDIPDRTFHNIHTSWRLSSAESNTDVKELIPEFFSSHEFLLNLEGFDYGKRQNGEEVNDVVLPPWCEGNARRFMLIHRQALESDYVTENICGWLDLVFGYKQRGEAAVKAINVFHPATYFGLDVSSVKNSLDRKAIQTMVRTYGQTPKQLFSTPHPRQDRDSYGNTVIRQTEFTTATKKVIGLKWGSYLGSPDRLEPMVVWEEKYQCQVATLVALPTSNGSSVFGIGAKSCLLLQNSQKQKSTLAEFAGVEWAAILTWGQQDGIVRIINGFNKPALNLLRCDHEITCCVSTPDCRHLFFGNTSGMITIYNTKHNPAKESELQVFGHRRCLYGHTGAISALVLCKPYSIVVSGSQDATCIIWDLNRLSYVRSIRGHRTGVQVVAVSDTLGDIASVSHYGMDSHVLLHTVNGEFVAKVTCEDTVNCLTYSTAPEGVSINVIAGGLTSGIIRLWSSWDLTPVRDLVPSSVPAAPIVSVTFTKDSQKLYVSSSDGRVRVWDYSGPSQHRWRVNKAFKNFLFVS